MKLLINNLKIPNDKRIFYIGEACATILLLKRLTIYTYR